MQVILFSNGRLITPELAALLGRIPPGQVVEISVYGMHSGSYDAVTGTKGAFEEFRRGVNLLLTHHVPFIVKGALLPQNQNEMAEFEAWAATIPAMKSGTDFAMNFDLRVRRDDPAKNRKIAALRRSPAETVEFLARNPEYVSGMREFCGRFMGPCGDRLFSCGAGHAVAVDAYGNAQMCLTFRHPDMICDLREHTLRDAITRIFLQFRERKAENPEYLRRCAVCFLKGLCEQCPAKSWMEHGTLDTPVEYFCNIAHAQARYLGLIGEHELAWEVPNWPERVKQFTKRDA
jgi:radical SAM protein with 4Fe4S-binding SPASM domain